MYTVVDIHRVFSGKTFHPRSESSVRFRANLFVLSVPLQVVVRRSADADADADSTAFVHQSPTGVPESNMAGERAWPHNVWNRRKAFDQHSTQWLPLLAPS
jgi:hypothetical protein